jgi:hypothetical protein
MIDLIKTMLLGLLVVIPLTVVTVLFTILLVKWPFYVMTAFTIVLFLIACYNFGSILKEKK